MTFSTARQPRRPVLLKVLSTRFNNFHNQLWKTCVRPTAFVASVNKFLVSISSYEYHGVDDESDGRSMRHFWVDPESGAVQLAVGELRPLLHQTSRTLQPGAAPNELWAAIYDPKARKTGVGIYNSRSLTFTPRVSVRKISFTSAHLWADAGAGRFYYVYKGHLLALPLPPKKAR